MLGAVVQHRDGRAGGIGLRALQHAPPGYGDRRVESLAGHEQGVAEKAMKVRHILHATLGQIDVGL